MPAASPAATIACSPDAGDRRRARLLARDLSQVLGDDPEDRAAAVARLRRRKLDRHPAIAVAFGAVLAERIGASADDATALRPLADLLREAADALAGRTAVAPASPAGRTRPMTEHQRRALVALVAETQEFGLGA